MVNKRFFNNGIIGGTKKMLSFKRQNIFNIFLLIIVMLSFLTTYCMGEKQTMGEELYQQALGFENQNIFSKAIDFYEQALPVLKEENNLKLATECREALQRIIIFQESYPYNIDQLEELIRQEYPMATDEQIEKWISNKEMEHYFWDGEDHYFVDAINNLSFHHIELIHANPVKDQIYHDLVLGINKDVQKEPLYSWLQYQNPATYRGTYNISIPRNELPDTGTYRI